MKTKTRWGYVVRGVKLPAIEKRLADIEYDKIVMLPARFDARTTIYYKNKQPVYKVVHKTLKDIYNAYQPY